MKYSGRQATREEAVGKGASWGAPGSSCILSWRTNMDFNTKRYHIVKMRENYITVRIFYLEYIDVIRYLNKSSQP